MLLVLGCRWQWGSLYPDVLQLLRTLISFRAATEPSSSNHSRRWLASLVAGADVAGIPACASVALVDDATGEAVAFEQVHTGGSG